MSTATMPSHSTKLAVSERVIARLATGELSNDQVDKYRKFLRPGRPTTLFFRDELQRLNGNEDAQIAAGSSFVVARRQGNTGGCRRVLGWSRKRPHRRADQVAIRHIAREENVLLSLRERFLVYSSRSARGS